MERTYKTQQGFWQARSFIGVQYAASPKIDIGIQCKIQRWIHTEGQLLYRFKLNADLDPGVADTFKAINDIRVYEPTATIGMMISYRFGLGSTRMKFEN